MKKLKMIRSLIRRVFQSFGFDIVRRGFYGSDRYLDEREFQYVLTLDRVYQKIAHVPGNLVEVGVARGRNAIIFGNIIRLNGDAHVRKYYGFDTFTGFCPEDLSRGSGLDPTRWQDTSVEFVQRRIASAGLEDVSYIYEGDVRKSAKQFIDNGGPNFAAGALRVALLYIDCNAYAPALESMRAFRHAMMPGAIICIDEKKQGEETRALEEFAAEEGLVCCTDLGSFSIPAYVRIPDNTPEARVS